MIVAYFTEDEKYLEKGDYRKDFDANSIAELVSNIKVKEPVLIKASSKDIFDFKFNTNPKIEGDFDFEVLKSEESIEVPIFDYQKVQQDAKNDVSYALYEVNEKYHNLLGKEIYFCKDRAIQLFLVKDRDVCTFMYEDWRELKKNVLQKNEIGEILVSKMWLTDTEIAEEIANGNLATQEGR